MNPGYDQIEPREIERPLLRAARLRAADAGPRLLDRGRARARGSGLERADPAPLRTATLARAARPRPRERPRGFLLVYVNSFNEWHEGHAFEPMKDAAELDPRRARPRLPQPRRTATTGCRRSPSCAAAAGRPRCRPATAAGRASRFATMP